VTPFTLEQTAAGCDVQIVAAGGAVGLLEAHKLERRVVEGICAGRTRVVVDLRDVTAVEPGLIAALLRIRRGVTQIHGRLALVVCGPPVSELVTLPPLARLIDVAVDRREAVVLVSAPTPG
jgi:anti-anti-sigma regulatory factor